MSDIRKLFPSKHLKASDLEGREVAVVISHLVENEEVGQDRKPVLYLQDKRKGLVLNKTNALAIQQMYGPETANWSGKTVVLYSTVVDFRGTPTETIRVRVQNSEQKNNGTQDGSMDLDDDIPF